MDKKRDEIVEKIISVLAINPDGLIITELVKLTNLNRSSIRTALAKLDGGNKVSIKKIGMAKVYSLSREGNK